jgi:predicted RNA-binding Zn-ribbon protein involved in translation (DUF1610 family)
MSEPSYLSACRAGEHPLEDILTIRSIPLIETVVRWCPTCGAVVIDMDSDNRTNAGAVMKMRVPEVTTKTCGV